MTYRGIDFTISADKYEQALADARNMLIDWLDPADDDEIYLMSASAVLDAIDARYVWISSQWLPRGSEQVREIRRLREWNAGEPINGALRGYQLARGVLKREEEA